MDCRPGHAANVSRAAVPVKPRPSVTGSVGRIETEGGPVPGERDQRKMMEANMDQRIDPRIVETPTEARQGSKYGIVRYVLAISTALVVIAFAVAYMTSV